jgi:hypothetical protein
MPIDAEPDAGGNVYLDSDGQAHVVDMFTPSDTTRWTSHWATCTVD